MGTTILASPLNAAWRRMLRYSRYGYRGGIGIGGALLIVLILYLLVSQGRI